jgi:hypothetical protein
MEDRGASTVGVCILVNGSRVLAATIVSVND